MKKIISQEIIGKVIEEISRYKNSCFKRFSDNTELEIGIDYLDRQYELCLYKDGKWHEVVN